MADQLDNWIKEFEDEEDPKVDKAGSSTRGTRPLKHKVHFEDRFNMKRLMQLVNHELEGLKIRVGL